MNGEECAAGSLSVVVTSEQLWVTRAVDGALVDAGARVTEFVDSCLGKK